MGGVYFGRYWLQAVQTGLVALLPSVKVWLSATFSLRTASRVKPTELRKRSEQALPVWVAVKELMLCLSWGNPINYDIIYIYIHTHYGNLI